MATEPNLLNTYSHSTMPSESMEVLTSSRRAFGWVSTSTYMSQRRIINFLPGHWYLWTLSICSMLCHERNYVTSSENHFLSCSPLLTCYMKKKVTLPSNLLMVLGSILRLLKGFHKDAPCLQYLQPWFYIKYSSKFIMI